MKKPPAYIYALFDPDLETDYPDERLIGPFSTKREAVAAAVQGEKILKYSFIEEVEGRGVKNPDSV